jgi:two-component system OmpR family sensor kinase
MSRRGFLRWIGPLVLLLLGVLFSLLASRDALTNYLFNGTLHFDLAFIFLLAGVLGGHIWAVVVLVNLSKRRRINAALKAERTLLAQERQRFLRRLDHELKNPLTTIRLGIANLQLEPGASGEMTGSLERVSHQAQRLQTLVENLRALSEMDEASLDKTVVDVREMLEDARELACGAPECHGRQVALTLQQVPWPVSTVSGDRDLLVTAFRNLVENALKFSAPEGRVEMRASEAGRSVLVEIDDTGRGIPAEDLPLIFDELYRGGNARDLPGSGLGLALVKRIIDLHGGSITVHSRSEQGTMVRVELPANPR